MSKTFEQLDLEAIKPTLASIQTYAQVLGKIRRNLSARQKHWGHITLYTKATGLTTSPMGNPGAIIEAELNFATHEVIVQTAQGQTWRQALTGQSPAAFRTEILAAIGDFGVTVDLDEELFQETEQTTYDPKAAETFWSTLVNIDQVFKTFKGQLRKETSPVQIWPHHFDLAMLWFSGRLIPDQDPDNEEYADEQMNFGFTFGDEGIPTPYFYITAYPLPDELPKVKLPEPAYWNTQGFQGAILKYNDLINSKHQTDDLLNFLKTVQLAGSSYMTDKNIAV